MPATPSNATFQPDQTTQYPYTSCEEIDQYEYLDAWFLKKLSSDNFEYAVQLVSGSPQLNHTEKCSLVVRLDTTGLKGKAFITLPTNDTSMTINSTLLSDVSVAKEMFHNSDSSLIFKRIYYSKSKGIVKYTTVDGKIWEIIN